MEGIFAPALSELSASNRGLFGPRSFRDYVEGHDLEAGPRTPRYISVDALEDLSPELRETGAMVFRTGSAPEGTGTAFVLVDADLEDFFLRDEAVFADRPVEELQSPVERERLLPYTALPTRSETSLVNLGLTSGVIAEALELDVAGPLDPPATGRSTFTFDVRPHSDLDSTVTHRNGQVEIDAVVLESRDGEPTLFVLEAKTGPRRSLAKHKLVYPVLAIAEEVPPDVRIVPVYLRCREGNGTVTFDVAECRLPDPRRRLPGIDDLEVTRSRVIDLELPG